MSPTEVSDLPPTANRSPHAHHQLPNVSRPRGPSRPKNANPVPVTVIDSSIVRGVGPFLNHSKDHDAVGYVYPGRTARYINGCLKNIPESDITVLSAGSNNIENQSVKDCAEEIRQTIDNIITFIFGSCPDNAVDRCLSHGNQGFSALMMMSYWRNAGVGNKNEK